MLALMQIIVVAVEFKYEANQVHFSWKPKVHSVAFLCSSSLNGIVSIVLHRKLKLLQNPESYSAVLYL